MTAPRSSTMTSPESRSHKPQTKPSIELRPPEEVDAVEIIQFYRDNAREHFRVDDDGVARYYVADLGSTRLAREFDPERVDDWDIDSLNRHPQHKREHLQFIGQIKLAHRVGRMMREASETVYGVSYFDSEENQKSLMELTEMIVMSEQDRPEQKIEIDFWKRECEEYERKRGISQE
jgi:hypothetical protein